MEVGVTWPADMPLAGVPAFAARVEALGVDTMHVPETIRDPFSVATLALAHTSRLTVRTSMVVAFARSPMVTALAAWDLAAFSGGRFQLGLASQVRGNVVGRFGATWSEPVARLGDYVDAVRAIFHAFATGEPLLHDGPHYRLDRLQPYFNPGPLVEGVAAPTIWTGGVNDRMCELAGRTADGFVAHPTSSHPRTLDALTVPALRRGADAAGRPALPRLVVGPQPLTGRDAAAVAARREDRRTQLGFLYSTPAYRRQLELFGWAGLGEALSAMAAAGDWTALRDHVTDEVLDTLVPQATYADLPGLLHDWYADRCDGIVLAAPDDPADDPAYARMVEAVRG